MKKFAILLFIILSSLAFVNRAPLVTLTYYFDAVSGNDNNAGTAPGTAYQNISKLITKMAIPLGQPGAFQSGDHVAFHRGQTFRVTTTVAITKSLIFEAYDVGARPIITGLKTLTFSATTGTSMWYSNETFVSDSDSMLDVVTRNDFNIQKGRWPNQNAGGMGHGYNTVKSATGNDLGSTNHSSTGCPGNAPCTMNQTTGSEVSGQPVIYPGVELCFKPEEFWFGREIVKTYDVTNRIITYIKSDTDRSYSPAPLNGYFIQNDSAALDLNYEWWYNKAKDKLKVFYNGGSAPTNISVAVVNSIFKINNVSNISITDLEIDGSNRDAIVLTGSGTNTLIDGNYIHNVGRNAINVGAARTTITNNYIKDCSSKGIVIETGGHHFTIDYDTIQNMGMLVGHNFSNNEDKAKNHSGVGVYVIRDEIGSVSHNRITNVGYAGIHFQDQDSVLMNYNYIDSFCTILADGGGIYGFSGVFKASKGRTIIGNTILNGIGNFDGRDESADPVGKGKASIYLDEWSSYVIVEGNFCFNASQGIFLNYGDHHVTIRNNTFVNADKGIQLNTRTSDQTVNLTIRKNLCLALNSTQVLTHFYSDNDAGLLQNFGSVDSNYYISPMNSTTYLERKAKSPASSARVNLSSWQGTFPYDDHSHTTTHTYTSTGMQDTSIRVEYNETEINKTVAMQANYVDDFGNTYNRSITLAPHTSAVLYKTSPLTPDVPGTGASIKYRRKLKM